MALPAFLFQQPTASPEPSITLPAFLIAMFAATQLTPYLGRFWAAAASAAEGGVAIIQTSVKQRGLQADMTQIHLDEIKRLYDELKERDKLNAQLGQQVVESNKSNLTLVNTNLDMQRELRESREAHHQQMERQEQRISTMADDSVRREELLKKLEQDSAEWKEKYEDALKWKPRYEDEHERAETLERENGRLKKRLETGDHPAVSITEESNNGNIEDQ